MIRNLNYHVKVECRFKWEHNNNYVKVTIIVGTVKCTHKLRHKSMSYNAICMNKMSFFGSGNKNIQGSSIKTFTVIDITFPRLKFFLVEWKTKLIITMTLLSSVSMTDKGILSNNNVWWKLCEFFFIQST